MASIELSADRHGANFFRAKAARPLDQSQFRLSRLPAGH
jgi:hypothetical protein